MAPRILVAAEGLHAARCLAAVRAADAVAVLACAPAQRSASWAAQADILVVLPTGLRDAQALVDAALEQGCGLIHPGSTRLLGDPILRNAAATANIGIVGAPQAAIDLARPRHRLREVCADLGIPCDPTRTPSTRRIAVTLAGHNGAMSLLGDRDITICRGDQVILAESPAAEVPLLLRIECFGAAQRLTGAIAASGLVEVHFHVDAEAGVFALADIGWAASEDLDALSQALGVDLHAWILRLALGEDPPWEVAPLRATGVGLALRLSLAANAPRSGRCTGLSLPKDTIHAVDRGDELLTIGASLALLVQRGEDRGEAYLDLLDVLRETHIHGVTTDRCRLHALLGCEAVRLARFAPALASLPAGDLPVIEVLEAGLQTTVQDLPGRSGSWAVGVPPSGPMDDLALALANRAVGNRPEAPGLEVTFGAASFRFPAGATIALAGAATAATVDDARVAWHTPIVVRPGGILRLGGIGPAGQRTCLAIRGGLVVADFLGSAATFTLGGFGGHAGRALAKGDEIAIGGEDAIVAEPEVIPLSERPQITRSWTIGVTYGPHGAPDFFTDDDITAFFAATWQVSPQSNRTGTRLIGPKPTWARRDGGEAGLHPSNIHDNAYALGSIDFTGDMPVILGPDGPSLGGFVCPAVVVRGERWKLGQLRPGDEVRFQAISLGQATVLRHSPAADPGPNERETPILDRIDTGPGWCLRRAGDDHLLIEVGEPRLDLGLRLRAQALHDALAAERITGIIDLTPGIRSLQVHYDSDLLPENRLIALLRQAIATLGDGSDLTMPSRCIHLPLSWDDPETRKAIEIYQRTVNPEAPWCPWNIEFIRRINGLDSVDDVQRIVFDAEYLVLGLGDVYLGAPVATPVDPRHRLVTTKYNPARTWTPENAVGIGGAYMCIYGMEGPGGYQFVGRTIQVWNSWRTTPAFAPGHPWLLRQFDRIRFFPVSATDLLRLREDFPHGRYDVRIDEGEFRLADHEARMATQAKEIAAFTARREAAFAAERERWAEKTAVPT